VFLHTKEPLSKQLNSQLLPKNDLKVVIDKTPDRILKINIGACDDLYALHMKANLLKIF